MSGGRNAYADGKEAQRMIDLFTSVGARSLIVTKTELEWPDHKKPKWGRDYSIAELKGKLPAMVRTAEKRVPYELSNGRNVMTGENLIVRPSSPDIAFIQLDDIAPGSLDYLRPAAFLKLAAQRHFTVEEIAAELLNVSEKARQKVAGGDPSYVTVTAKNAFDAWGSDKARGSRYRA
jgi:hypothetical protein